MTVHPCTILQINRTRCTILLSIFISLLYIFRATVCPSSGDITVSMRHWYLLLASGLLVGVKLQPADHTATHAEWQIPVSHRYSNFFWWWAHGCPKHVEKRNKYTKQNCAPSWIYLQDGTSVWYQEICRQTAPLKYRNKQVEHPLKIQVAKADSSHLWLRLQKAIQLLIHISALFIRSI